MTPFKEAFDTYEVITPRKVHLEDNSIVEGIGMGTIVVQVMVKGQPKRVHIYDVLHVPMLKANLLSVSKLVSIWLMITSTKEGCSVIAPSGKVIVKAPREDNLYQMTFTKVHMRKEEEANAAQASSKQAPLEL